MRKSYGFTRQFITAIVLVASSIGFAVAQSASPNDTLPHFNALSMRSHFNVSLRPEQGKMPIGRLHVWIVRVTDHDDRPVSGASIAVGGGMAAHGHGLPTQPQVTAYLGDGEYRIEGIKFNMAGNWTLRVGIEKDNLRDIAQVDFDLDF